MQNYNAMKNTEDTNYAAVLKSLMTRLHSLDDERAQLVKVINGLNSIVRNDKIIDHTSNYKPTKSRKMSGGVYETTLELLEKTGKPLSTDEVYSYLVDNNIVPRDRPRGNVITVMYKAARNRKDSNLVARDGIWRLKNWNN